jgi:hypothetical protein
MADILADTERYLAEAKQTLKAVNSGAKLSPGMTREDAVRILTENIILYEARLRRYGRKPKA